MIRIIEWINTIIHLKQLCIANSKIQKISTLLIHVIDISKNKESKFRDLFQKSHGQSMSKLKEIPLQYLKSNNSNLPLSSSPTSPKIINSLKVRIISYWFLHPRIYHSTQFLLNKCLMNEYIKHCDRGTEVITGRKRWTSFACLKSSLSYIGNSIRGKITQCEENQSIISNSIKNKI